jgi:hypothetical protein
MNRIRNRIKVKGRIRHRLRIKVTIRTRISIKMTSRIRIRIQIRIKMMRIRNTAPDSYGSGSRVRADPGT